MSIAIVTIYRVNDEYILSPSQHRTDRRFVFGQTFQHLSKAIYQMGG
jgi:hypothetical protein